MNIANWLKDSQRILTEQNITTARLDCLVLLEDETGKDCAWLLSHPEFKLQRSVLEKLSTKIAQRAKHIPLAYIRGKAEFYGREFAINEHTLVPRPETETMIELLKTLKLTPSSRIADIGTGSGCLAITAALELPGTTLQACDIDSNCLRMAEQNAQELGAPVQFRKSDLLQNVTACDVLLCNLPYVPEDFHINTAATHEPKHAIFGGTDGLDYYRQMFKQITKNDWRPSYILTESLPPQHEALAAIARAGGYSLHKTDDFIQVFVV